MARWLTRIRHRLTALVRGRARDRDVDEELRDHIARDIAARLARGEPPVAARQAALAGMGSLPGRLEASRDTRGWTWLSDAGRDLRGAIRTLRRRPLFAIVAMATLALGTGATTAMFTVVNGVLLRPLDFPDPDRLVLLSVEPGGPFGNWNGLIEEHFLAVRDGDQLMTGVAAFNAAPKTMLGAGDPTTIAVQSVTDQFFRVGGLLPLLGRGLADGDDNPSHEAPVVIGTKLWHERFAARADVVGAHISLDGVSHVIVGVMGADVDQPFAADAWVPLVVRVDPHNALARAVVGRLKPGATAQAVARELTGLTRPSIEAHGERADSWKTSVISLEDFVVGDARPMLLVLIAAVVFVLLIACANVASLFLARTSERDRELSVRLALGAGRGRLVRQLWTESLVVAIISGACGLLLTRLLLPIIVAAANTGVVVPRLHGVRIDGTIFAFAIGLSVLTALVFGTAPALRSPKRATSLTVATRGWSAPHERVHHVLIVAEIALSLMLLAGAGLLAQSLARMRAVPLGFTPGRTSTLTIDLPDASYRGTTEIRAFHDALLARLSSIAGMRTVAAVNWMPFGDAWTRGDFTLDGGRTLPKGYVVSKPAVSPGFFATMGIRQRAGRDFSALDRSGAPGAAIVSASVAAEMWPGENAIGQRLSMDDHPKPEDWLTVVGVVDDVKQHDLASVDDRTIYLPYMQVRRDSWLRHMTFVFSGDGDASQLASAVRTVFRDAGPALPFPTVVTTDALLARATAAPRFRTALLLAFAVTALLLTIVGIYGVLAYSVSQRTRDIGIRMALGAHHRTVAFAILKKTMMLSAIGIAIGLAGALSVARVLRQFLFHIAPTDVPTLAVVAVLLFVVAVAAAAIPARRAARVDPATTLRAE